jgi:hypothetical protein
MVDRDIAGAGWLTLPGSAFQVRPAAKKETHCQVRTDFAASLGVFVARISVSRIRDA